MAIPTDIFTEPEDVDPNTLANLGPLRRLAGTWVGTSGADVNPKADGPEHKVYTERTEFWPIDPQSNGPQLFYGLRYHTHINSPDEEITLHDQTGYWLWEPATGLITQSLAIPRGQVALASGFAAPDADRLVVEAVRGQTDYGICSTSFLEQAFRSDHYRLAITFNSDGTFDYVSELTLTVHGQANPFNHRDTNRMTCIAAPSPNPWAVLADESEAK